LENKLIEQQKIKADIHACERQYRARVNTIGEKDIQISALQKKIQELEKFKFVLDYKIKELKTAICPKEVQI
jgi:cilia- and flagella-associated protein 57